MGIKDWISNRRDQRIRRLISRLDYLDKRDGAVIKLANIGDAAVPLLAEALKDGGPDIRWGCAAALGSIRSHRAGTALVEALRGDIYSQICAAWALAKADCISAVPVLVSALKSNDANVRTSAAVMLTDIGEPAIPPLVELFEDKYERMRIDEILHGIGKDAVPRLIGILEDKKYWKVHDEIARFLGETKDARAVPSLIEAHRFGYMDVKVESAKALVKIGEPAVIPLIEALEDESSNIRVCATDVLGWIGGERAVVPLIEALKDEIDYIRGNTVMSLVKLAENTDIDLDKVRASLHGYVKNVEEPEEREKAKQEAASAYTDIAAAVAKRKQAQMPGTLSPGTVPKPTGKKDMYRMRRVMNG